MSYLTAAGRFYSSLSILTLWTTTTTVNIENEQIISDKIKIPGWSLDCLERIIVCVTCKSWAFLEVFSFFSDATLCRIHDGIIFDETPVIVLYTKGEWHEVPSALLSDTRLMEDTTQTVIKNSNIYLIWYKTDGIWTFANQLWYLTMCWTYPPIQMYHVHYIQSKLW